MSRETYARGFVKSSSAMGVDPVALAKFAQEISPIEYFQDDPTDLYYIGRSGPYRAWNDPLWRAERGMDPRGDYEEPWKQTESYKMMQEFNDPARNTPEKQIARARRWGVRVPAQRQQLAGSQNAQQPQTVQQAPQPQVAQTQSAQPQPVSANMAQPQAPAGTGDSFDFRGEAVKLLRGAKQNSVKLDKGTVAKMRSQWKDISGNPQKYTAQQQRDILAQWRQYVGRPSGQQMPTNQAVHPQNGTAIAGSGGNVTGQAGARPAQGARQSAPKRRKISISPIRGRNGQDIRSISLRT